MLEDTRHKVINTFFELALENPDKITFTVSDIAHQAGLTRQAIYRKHFKSFQEIINYVHAIAIMI